MPILREGVDSVSEEHEHYWSGAPTHVELPARPAKRWCRGCGLLQGKNSSGFNGLEWVDMGIIEPPDEPPPLVVVDLSKYPKRLGSGWWQLSNGIKLRSRTGDEAYAAQARLMPR